MRPLLLALLGLCCLTAPGVEGVGSEAVEQRICVSLTTRQVPVNRIKTYTIKEGTMRAIIFFTKRGLKVCADPRADWVKRAVEKVDKDNSSNKSQTKAAGTPQPTRAAVTRRR
ncbi:lymphotactin [Molossus nigricans]